MPQKRPPPRNIKVAATSIIWGCAVGMFALCIPLIERTGSGPILPLAVLLGTGLSTIVIWRSPNELDRDVAVYTRALETRIEILETICSHADLELSQRLRSLESETLPSPRRDRSEPDR